MVVNDANDPPAAVAIALDRSGTPRPSRRAARGPDMARSAREEGFDEIADWFETLAKAEKSHAGRFQKALDSMD